ncbi:hypothetical protein [Pseudonocardia asaccharolytica]|uniref:Uncharacterized protein n=1 Tax=Pseudonocardia asaccharolytica DSM 44247 = NBRC 16224 TaxID=1123024 RepID=A0A511D3G4_9PSEU|nr:hypothetical protein [Pseudonocardia asaccharolytica]GEL19320.1 hypothetical protein PA7_31570 [Pseudonocardia asaccharolytica DSM 44247 = NBRC 16224]
MTGPEYANALAISTLPIIAAVRNGDIPALRVATWTSLSITPPPGVDPYEALVTVLAAQVDEDTTLSERLAWARAFDPRVAAACQPRRTA